jgi:hypothetical protein
VSLTVADWIGLALQQRFHLIFLNTFFANTSNEVKLLVQSEFPFGVVERARTMRDRKKTQNLIAFHLQDRKKKRRGIPKPSEFVEFNYSLFDHSA